MKNLRIEDIKTTLGNICHNGYKNCRFEITGAGIEGAIWVYSAAYNRMYLTRDGKNMVYAGFFPYFGDKRLLIFDECINFLKTQIALNENK